MALVAAAGTQVIVETHSDHIVEGIQVAVFDGLIKPEQTCFHYFYFDEAVADLINEEINGKRICRKVIRSWQLDEACHQWDIESQPTYPMFARPESRKTMTNKKLAHMRQATCPNTARRH